MEIRRQIEGQTCGWRMRKIVQNTNWFLTPFPQWTTVSDASYFSEEKEFPEKEDLSFYRRSLILLIYSELPFGEEVRIYGRGMRRIMEIALYFLILLLLAIPNYNATATATATATASASCFCFWIGLLRYVFNNAWSIFLFIFLHALNQYSKPHIHPFFFCYQQFCSQIDRLSLPFLKLRILLIF